jgi:twitching motility protein PilT
MQTFDQALLGYTSKGLISEEVAMQTATSPHDFKLMLAASGRKASGIEQNAPSEANGSGDQVPADQRI